MLDTAVYLDKLALFGRILRQEGLFVSPDEDADAVARRFGRRLRQVAETMSCLIFVVEP